MSNLERVIINFFENKKTYVLYVAITLIALGVRYSGINFISNDMQLFLLPWYETIANHGSTALKDQVGDYGLLYQTITFFLIRFPLFAADTKYKLVSILFDFLLALCASYAVCTVNKKSIFSSYGVIAYSVVILCPTVILNSSYWGQCDSIYTFFCLMTIVFLMNSHYKRAFIFYGIALAFKLQAIFLLPFILCYYVCKKAFSIINFFISIFFFWFSGIAAYLSGRDLLAPFTIYAYQTKEFSNGMYINIASFWQLIGQDNNYLKLYSILFTIGILVVGLYDLLDTDNSFDTNEKILSFAAWTVWTCVLFLPQMHERYTYMVDILLIILSFSNKKYIFFAFTSITISTMTYAHYLFVTPNITSFSTIIYLGSWLLFTFQDSLSLMNSSKYKN